MGELADPDRMRTRLLERQTELESVVDSGDDAARPVELDQARVGRLTRMDALQAQAMAQESGRRRRLELRRIEAALARIDSGDYGYCFACDEPIPQSRLAIDPAATLCVGCASTAEG